MRFKFLKFILVGGDFLLFYLSLFLTLLIRYHSFSFLSRFPPLLQHFSFLYLLWLGLLFLLDFYEISLFKNLTLFFSHIFIFSFLALAIGTIYFYLNPWVAVTPKTILVVNIFLISIFLIIWRFLFTRILKHKNLRTKIIILGTLGNKRNLLSILKPEYGYEIVAVVNPDKKKIYKLKELIEKEKINTVVICPDIYENKNLIQEIFSTLPLRLNFIPLVQFYESVARKIPVEIINEYWILENLCCAEKRMEEVFKRGFDIIFSFIGFLFTLILFPFIALAIKLDTPGPIFYFQERVGKGGKIFKIYKFRTMIKDAEKNGPQWATANDERVTRVGKFLRKTHLDEFPQFYNILKGELSFVGPRPERPEFVTQLKKVIPYYEIRHLVKPGLTGWAQINYHYGGSVEGAKEKFSYELYYIKNRSFLLDVGIILKTIATIWR